ncbi:MAG: ABC transporter permease [Firmicutes bacterium]|nr:ABC transporter permease [Bacillota bacterium]
MKPRTFFYFLREALRGLVRNRVMTLTALGIITIGLFLFGLFFLLTANLHHLTVLAWDGIEVRVFLEPTVTNPEKIGAELAALPGVKKVKYVSKAEGAAALERMLGNQNLFLNGENPLPAAFNLSVQEAADLPTLARQAAAIPGVEEVVFKQEFVKFLEIAIRLIMIFGFALLSLTAFAVLYIIVNTIQLTVYARRQELEIMKLVGATDTFVRWPFLLEGIILGLLGAGLALLFLREGYSFLVDRIQHYRRFLPLLSGPELELKLTAVLLGMGLFFGGFGSYLSLKRYLKV